MVPAIHARTRPGNPAHAFFATTAKGMEALLADELRALGAADVVPQRAGVGFGGTLEMGYRACLWSRVASRVLLPLVSFPAETPAALYAGVRTIRWSEHVSPRTTIAVDCAVSHSRITHSHFAALKTKDAIVDQLREHMGARPSVAVERPDVRINVYLHEDRATVSIDLSGESLHRRSYRQAGGVAPLKENLAAAVLLLADWPRLARQRVPLLDPMCGSGTLCIEAALIAADIAPGHARSYFGFLGWRGHDAAVWTQLMDESDAREIRDPKRLPLIRGYDADAAAVRNALANVARAGLRGRVHIERRGLAECEPIVIRGGPSLLDLEHRSDPTGSGRAEGSLTQPPPTAGLRGLVVTNPPYGERLGDRAALAELYPQLGDTLRRRFPGWTAYVLTGNPSLGRSIGLRPSRRHILYNGAIECRLLVLPISSTPVQSTGPGWRRPAASSVPTPHHQ
jgi:23S rRNA (guanine2445-N2)-methyltransferase / 23S rRNA (guanine2069-N7)-methyltransferase